MTEEQQVALCAGENGDPTSPRSPPALSRSLGSKHESWPGILEPCDPVRSFNDVERERGIPLCIEVRHDYSVSAR